MALAGQHQSELSSCSAALADIAEEITRRLEAGEPLDEDQLLKELPELATEIRRLLPALRSLAELEDSSPPTPVEGLDLESSRTLGEFRIVREIGRGGMGVVYEAEQSSLGRRVALKVLPTAGSLDERAHQRFRLESQAAALLVHPNIVPVYTVGEFDGLPYYAMQFIEGSNLAEILAELRRAEREPGARASEGESSDAGVAELANRLLQDRLAIQSNETADSGACGEASPSSARTGSTPKGSAGSSARSRSTRSRTYVRAVVKLAVQAAEALQYAHEQGIVHRDVKPANLLLDRRGKLWLTDFGLARISTENGLTRTGDLPGTLRYMSPEQARGGATPIDPRTDLYSLGATVYELLTLRPAIPGRDRLDLLRNIADVVPTAIRRENPAVARDLETIIGRCLAKDPVGRYATARALAEDLSRFLDSRPILAHPVGPAERFVRWCRRKPAMAAALLGLMLSLAGGVIGITVNWREAVRQRDLLDLARRQATLERDQKELERQKAEAARERAESAERQARESAEVAGAVKDFLNDKILLQAGPSRSPSQRNVTLLEAVNRASEDVGKSFAKLPQVEAEIRTTLAMTFHDLGENAKAEQHARIAYDYYRQHLGEASEKTCRLASSLAEYLGHLGRLQDAEKLIRETHAVVERAFSADHPVSELVDVKLGDLELSRGNYQEAERLFRRRLEATRGSASTSPATASGIRYRLAHSLQRLGRPDEAEPLLRESVEIGRKAYGARSVGTLAAINNLGTLLEQRGRLGEAEVLFRENLQATVEVSGPRHRSTLIATENLAFVMMRQGRLQEAETLLREALGTSIEAFGPDNPTTLELQVTLIDALSRSGKYDEARELGRKTFVLQARILGTSHPYTRKTANLLERIGPDR